MGRLGDFQNDDTELGEFRRRHFDDNWTMIDYPYLDRDGKLFETVVRADKKGQAKVCRNFAPDGSYMGTVKRRSRPLYGLLKLRGDGPYKDPDGIIIVEVEKCADAAQKFFDDYIVLTYAGGASSIDYSDWKPLQGKEILIIADNDNPGLASALLLSDKLTKLRCLITIYSRHGEDKSDIADWIEECKNAEEETDLRQTILDGAVSPSEVEKSGPDERATTGRAVSLPEFEPWPDEDEAVGSDVLSSLADLINRHMYIKPEQADATALWCAMAWLHDDQNLELAPFLNITAPSSRAGKTALLDIVAEIVPRPFPLVGASEAFLFRVIEEHAPTLLLDEIDTQRAKKNGQSAYLDGMLNGSQTRRTATIGRMAQIRNGQAVEQVAVTFSTWCPKVLCGIGGLADTTVERSIQIRMDRKPKTELRPRWRNRDRQAVMDLCRKIGTWVKGNADEIITARGQVKLPETINDRQWDSWEVLGAIAKVAGGDWPKRAVAACKYITDASEDTRSYGELLIGDLSAIFSHKEGEGFITSAVICEFLNKMEERPWSHWNKGRGFNPSALAQKLKPFNIKPRQKKQRGSPQRGYDYGGLEPLFSRYPVTEGDNHMENIGNFGNGSETPI